MAPEYSVDVCNKLKASIEDDRLHRPMRVERYDAGAELTYDVAAVDGESAGQVRLKVDKFVGGGFAGQVYRVKVLSIESEQEHLGGLEVGGVYAMKILIPPTGLSRLFRNVLYRVGFQGPFQLQVNPTAAKAGAIWQKFIRRAAQIRFGDENAVNDIHATFVDHSLGSCGELSDWVEGRTWRLEVDDRLDVLKLWRRGKKLDTAQLGSPEYRAKKKFMADFVTLLHEMGAREFARQYEWSTCKSQPNCLKRMGTDDDPAAGLTAVDFRAGLTLLPFLPMSPGDFKLIGQGVKRGSIVQFDRGDLKKLECFIDSHAEDFADMRPLLEELKSAEDNYRNSVPDITHNHVRLLYSRKLWGTIFESTFTGWKVRGLIEADHKGRLSYCNICRFAFFLLGLIPFLGRFLRKFWAHAEWREHYKSLFGSFDYFRRAFRAKIAETAIKWHRAGRVNADKTLQAAKNPLLILLHLPLTILPAGLHRFLTDGRFFCEKLHYVFIRPFQLYFFRKHREQWLRDMVTEGRRKHILADEDAETILGQLKEKFIQRYLVSLVVHMMTAPVTQIVSGLHAWWWNTTHPEVGGAERTAVTLAILAAYQVIPISPGSFCRGLYTTLLALYDRNFKDYNIALFLSYFKYLGYLAFPIQMSYHYPVISRFMAAHWATDAVHIVPVFGERGALFERWVFCLFYNWPLTIRRRMKKIAQHRQSLKPRYWHIPICAFAAAGAFAIAERIYLNNLGTLPTLRNLWYLSFAVPFVCGAAVTWGCGGVAMWKRIAFATLCGLAVGILFTIATAGLNHPIVTVGQLMRMAAWRVFALMIFAAIGAIVRELTLPDPDLAV